MPGRQSHGRSLMGNAQASTKKSKTKNQKSKSKAQAHAQDAYAIAAKQIEPDRLTRRSGRELELDPERPSRGGKHSRDDEDDDDEDEEEEDERPQKKRPRQANDDDNDGEGSDADGGSDSDGNVWHVGVNGDDEDSELDSDEAFGDSDDDKFEGYTFRGSRSQKKADESDDEGGDDGASLGSDAIDLADALDQSSDDDDEGSTGDTESGSEEEAGSDSDSDDEDVDVSKLGELHNLIKDYANNADDVADEGPSSKQMISLEDLGLSGVKDPLIKKALKLMKKEESADASKKGSSKTLDVPLPRRQQSQLLRAAAYEKTNETLDRWNETVKHNRRADHLVFPLPQNAHDAGLDNQELIPLTKKTAGTELEQTILAIMEESGLGPSAKAKEQEENRTDANDEEQTISRSELKDLWAQRRKDRELQSREQTRAKRIKKIKSKTYRRVHRKERLGDEADMLETMRANGEINSDEEREAAHRRRALERVGAKHKESKWAKMGSKAGRAVWDDDYRAGLTDMARRNEELRKRVEGKADSGSEDESDGASVSGDEDGSGRLLKELDAADDVDDDDDHPHSGLMSLKFMQRAEAQRKKDNDALVAEIRRELASGSESEEDDTEVQVGRQTFGMGPGKKAVKPTKKSSTVSNGGLGTGGNDKTLRVDPPSTTASAAQSTAGGAGEWASTGKSAVSERKKGRKAVRNAEVAELELAGIEELASLPAPKPKAATKKSAPLPAAAQADGDDSSDDDIHLPLALRDHELVDRAFGGDDVVAEFEEEKAAIMSEDDEKIIKTTLPGWGSWTGEGISKRAQKRNKGKVTTTKKDGIKKKDRQDAKLSKVIVNEKRNRKNGKYLASQLPHPFESRQQYERSLRLPVGPEWMTKESFQQGTKPRVIVKQGIIAPMAKPTI